MGADYGILLNSKSFAGSDTLATSYILSQAIKKIGGVDLVLFGKQTIDSDTGQVGPITAEFLDLPQITNVMDIEAKHKALVVSRAFDSSISLLEVSLPAVITVTDEINIPRVPTIYSISVASKSEIIVWNESDIEADTNRIGVVGSPTVVRRILEPKKKEKNTIFIKGNVKEVVSQLAKLMTDYNTQFSVQFYSIAPVLIAMVKLILQC
ncbi:Acryloyl-CoA reductase electron transfer subunit gamma [Streptococcus parauberis]|nr:Acryloyl-CoA reductase electron transfer subunit gamma [Streptococcus parauberis]